MKQLLAKYKYEFLLFAIGILWIEFFNILLQVTQQHIIYPDSQSYVNASKDLYLFFRGHLTRPIGMALITGFPLIFKASDATLYVFGFCVNLVCWLFFLLLLFQILKEFLKPNIAFLSTLTCMLILGNTASVFHVSSESIYMLFMVTAMFFLWRYYKNNSLLHLAWALFFIIISVLIKPGSLLFAIIFTLYFIVKIYKMHQSKVVYLIYASWLLIGIQCAGLKYQFGNFTTSYIDAITYYCYLGAKAASLEKQQDFHEVWLERTHFIYNQAPPNQKKIAKADLIKHLETNRVNLGKAYLQNLFENATTGSVPIHDCKNVNRIKYFSISKKLLFELSVWQNIAFSILALLLSSYLLIAFYKTDQFLSIIAAFILYTILLSGVSCSEGDRFNVITFPFVVVLIAKWLSKKSKRTAQF